MRGAFSARSEKPSAPLYLVDYSRDRMLRSREFKAHSWAASWPLRRLRRACGGECADEFSGLRRGMSATTLSPHSFRVAAITNLLTQGVSLEDAQNLANHADPRTTRLYDRRQRKVTRSIVERIPVYAESFESEPAAPLPSEN